MGKGEVARKNVHFNIKKLKELTVNAMAAIDAEYWNKCVSKVMKEVHQYMIYDELIPADVVEDNSPLDLDIPEDDVTMPSTSSSSKESNDQLKNIIVKQCTEELISPRKLAEMHQKSERTIRNWVKSSGAQLPLKYLEKKSQRKIAFTPFYVDDSLLTTNDATQRLSKQLVLNLKSNWPSLSNTIESQPNSSNSKNCETISLEPDHEKKSKIDENKLGRKKIILASHSLNTTAHVLDLEELTDDPPAQNSSTENQPLVTDMLACSRDQCGFKTKLKRCLDLHIKGNKST